MPVRDELEKFILKFLDSTENRIAVWSARCFHSIQQVKGGSVEGLNAQQAWKFYQIKLIGNLHQLLDILFANVTEFYDDPVEKSTLKIPKLILSDEPNSRVVQVKTRFNNLVRFLKVALLEEYSAKKLISPTKILNLIIRGLSVSCDMLRKNPTADNIAVGLLLPFIQIDLLSLLNVLIKQ